MSNTDEGKTAGKIGAVSIGPGVGAALLAKASCPLCYPAIGGFLTSIGLGFLFEGIYFYIIMSVFFGIGLFGLAFRAKSRRGYLPFWLGLVGSCIAILGRYYANEIIFYVGITILIGASIWNLIPKKESCSACVNSTGGTNE
jgi:mercuric ion transport protein